MHSKVQEGPEGDRRSVSWPLLVLVFLSHVLVALLIWMISGPAAFLNPDTGHYVLAADSLRRGSFFINGSPEIFRTPGYPLLLVPAVAGDRPILALALFENFVLATMTAWLVWRIAALLFPGTKAAWWGVILYCFEPLGFLYTEQILSETAFTAFLMLFLWLFLRFLDLPKSRTFTLSAAALAGATYVRPVSLYLAFVLSLLLLFLPRGPALRTRIARALFFLGFFLLLLAPWVIRNTIVADYPGFSSAGDWNLYFCSAAAVQAKLEGRDFVTTQTAMGANNNDLYFQLHPERRAWTPGRIARAWGTEARQMIAPHWLLYLPIHAKGAAVVAFSPGVTEMLKMFKLYPETGGLLSRVQNEGPLSATLWLIRQYPLTMFLLPLLGLQMAIYYVLAVLGLRHMALTARITMIVIFAYVVLVSGMPAAVARYRAPVMPIVCICAVAAIARYRENRGKTQAERVATAGKLST